MSGTAPSQPPTTQPAALAAGQPKTSGLAIAALILSILPIACINVVGIVLGIVALVKINEKPTLLKGKGLAIAAIIVGVMWFFVGILAAIAIPNFLKFQARAKQSEAKVSLKSLYTAEKAFFAENGRFATTFAMAGWQPEASRRYTYFLGDDVIAPTQGEAQGLPEEVETYAREQSFQAAAIGNLDSDDTVDVWIIDQENQLQQLSDDTSN
jgi:type IV pilus assembly protein PilA